jgi:sugar phosphate isomerase/epimerase
MSSASTGRSDSASSHGRHLHLNQLGLAGHGVPNWRPEELLALASSRLEIHALDYWPWNRGTLAISEYRDLLNRFQIKVYVVNVPSSIARAGIPGQEELVAQALFDAIDEAVALEAAFVQFYTGVGPWAEFLTTAKMLARQLQPALERAADAGVTLLIENNLDQRNEDRHGLNPSRRPEMVLAVMEQVDSPYFGLCYDPCNFYAVGAEGFPYAYELLKPYIRNVHVKDCVRYSPLLHSTHPQNQKLLVDSINGPHLPVAVGAGAVNWGGIIRQLEVDRYEGWLTLDPFGTEETFTEWCLASARFLSGYIRFPHPMPEGTGERR